MMKNIILASASPRRHELLDLLSIKHEVIPCLEEEKNFNSAKKKETFGDKQNTTIEEKVLQVAYQKVSCVGKSLPLEKKSNSLIIGADTIVVIDDEIIGKPTDKADAINMLKKILGKTHEVYTGICIYDSHKDKILTAVERTLVSMIEWSEEKIIAYIDAESVLDKAGAYAIQGKGAALIDKIEGCYYNVMGLPLSRLVTMLDKLEYNYLINKKNMKSY